MKITKTVLDAPTRLLSPGVSIMEETSELGASGFYAPYIPVTMVDLTKAVTQAHYRHFLRINNRKRRWSADDLRRAGYPEATVVGNPTNNQEHPFYARQWCLENIDEGRFVRFANLYFFANAEDHLMFVMMWGTA